MIDSRVRSRERAWPVGRHRRAARARPRRTAQRRRVPMKNTENPKRRKTFAPRGGGSAARVVTWKKPSGRVTIVRSERCSDQRRVVWPSPGVASRSEPPPSGARQRAGSAIFRCADSPSAFLTAGLVEPGAHAAGAGDTLPVLLEVRIGDDVVVSRHLGCALRTSTRGKKRETRATRRRL